MTDQQHAERVRDEVMRRYGVPRAAVRVIFAPYRICPLGAHIDHQLGRVTAMALDQGVWLGFTSLSTPEARLSSVDFPGAIRFDFDKVPDQQHGDWGNYLRGAVRALQQRYRLGSGIAGVTLGSVPEGGLSSSAAVGVAYLLALENVNGLAISAEENIALDLYIENTYLGLRNGILDQAAILFSRQGRLTVIDCQTVQHQLVPKPPELPSFAILIVFSGVRQALVGTDYNRRVAECAEAARCLLNAVGKDGREPLLRNVTASEYAAHRQRLTGPPARRAAHYFSEMQRVTEGIAAWQRGDLVEFGRLISASGESSIRNYECGSPPLIDLYDSLVAADGVYGARFSGAGFRGCCVALVAPDRADRVAAEVHGRYVRQHPELAEYARVLVCRDGDGARVVV